MHFQHHPLASLVAFLLLTTPLLFHELGHWFVLYRLKIPVAEFGFGFGPRLFQIRRFCWRAFPLGAYVAPERESYLAASPESRLRVALGGPVANFGYAAALGITVVSAAPALPGRIGLLDLAALNLAVGFINLIPVPPLDGWAVFQSVAEMIRGERLAVSWERQTMLLQAALIYGFGALFLLWLLHPTRFLDWLF
jgi:membrane-associated protease RseP (regulator of RpoE activity)